MTEGTRYVTERHPVEGRNGESTMTTPAPTGLERSSPPGWVQRLATPTLTAVLVAAIGGILAMALGYSYVIRKPPVYASSSVLLIDQPGVIFSAGGDTAIVKLGLLRTKYASLIKTDVVTKPVADATGITQGEVARSLVALSPPQSLLLVIGARAGRPQETQALASAAAKEISAYLKAEQDKVGLPADKEVTLTEVQPAVLGFQIEPTTSRALQDGLAAGVISLIMIYVAVQLLTARPTSRP
jgi:capsular polysaccharide biosynthesis protein